MDEIDLDRLNPPFPESVPGAGHCLRGLRRRSRGKLPVYGYVGFLRLELRWQGRSEQESLGKLKATSSRRRVAGRRRRQTPRPHEVVPWQEDRSPKCRRSFSPRARRRADGKEFPAFFQLWWYDVPNGAVLLGSREAGRFSPAEGLAQTANLTAGTTPRCRSMPSRCPTLPRSNTAPVGRVQNAVPPWSPGPAWRRPACRKASPVRRAEPGVAHRTRLGIGPANPGQGRKLIARRRRAVNLLDRQTMFPG